MASYNPFHIIQRHEICPINQRQCMQYCAHHQRFLGLISTSNHLGTRRMPCWEPERQPYSQSQLVDKTPVVAAGMSFSNTTNWHPCFLKYPPAKVGFCHSLNLMQQPVCNAPAVNMLEHRAGGWAISLRAALLFPQRLQ